MGALENVGEEDRHLAYCGKDSEEGEMVLGGKWRSEELVELRYQALVHLSGEMRCFERNDLGFKAGNLRRGAECLNVRDILLWE